MNLYGDVCLLSMRSRVLTRVVAKKLFLWSERLGLLDHNHAGFHSGSSSAYVAQMIFTLQEEEENSIRRINKVIEHG